MKRRTYLTALSSTAAVGLAGCSSGPGTSCADDQRETATPVYGPDDAPSVELFSDYTCPGCAEYHKQEVPELKSAADQGTLKLVHRDYPLPHDDWSKPAAYLGRAVLDSVGMDAFWTYLDDTLAEDSLSEDTLISLATDAGLSEDDVTQELDTTQYCDIVSNSKQRGDSVNVEGTPQLYYQGELHDPISASQVIEGVS